MLPADPTDLSDLSDPSDPSDGPSLADLHEEILATAEDGRRGARRTLEVLKHLGGILDAMAVTLNDTHKAVRAIPAAVAAPSAGDTLPREWELALVEMADRAARVTDGFSRPPAPAASWWPGTRAALAAWREAWAVQAEACGILRGHLEALLRRAELVRPETVGRPFDPATMIAVESVRDAAHPDHTVLEELLPGWVHAPSGRLVRAAHVKVSRRPAA